MSTKRGKMRRMSIPDWLWELITFRSDFKVCYEMGLDAALNGPNTTNCDFRLFRSPEHTKAWEAGQAEGRERLSRRGKGA